MANDSGYLNAFAYTSRKPTRFSSTVIALPLAFLLCLCFFSETAFGRTVVVKNTADKTPVVVDGPDLNMEEILSTNGKPNSGFFYGTIFSLAGGVDVKFGQVQPGGRIAEHETASRYVMIVIRGSGRLVNFDIEGKESSYFEFQPGDVIIFEPHTMHSWENGDKTWEFIGVKERLP